MPVGCQQAHRFPQFQPDGGTTDGLSRGGIDHDVARGIVGQTLHQQAQARHEIELAHHLRRRFRRPLQQIDTGLQARQLQGVFKHLVVGMGPEGLRLCQRGQFLHALPYLAEVVAVHRVQPGVASQLGTVYAQRDAMQMAQG